MSCGVVGGDEGAAAGELQRRGAGGADNARARTQLQRADAVAAGGQLERRAAVGGGVERGLQHRALIDGAAGNEVRAAASAVRAHRDSAGRVPAVAATADCQAGGQHVAAVERHALGTSKWSMLVGSKSEASAG